LNGLLILRVKKERGKERIDGEGGRGGGGTEKEGKEKLAILAEWLTRTN